MMEELNKIRGERWWGSLAGIDSCGARLYTSTSWEKQPKVCSHISN